MLLYLFTLETSTVIKVFDNSFLQNLLYLLYMGTIVTKEIYSSFQMYMFCMSKKNCEGNIFILPGAILKAMCILKHYFHSTLLGIT